MKKAKLLFVLLMSIVIVMPLSGQNYWTNLTTNDGLVGNNINDILIQNRASIWIATPSGLSHYNGNTFTNYTNLNSTLANSNIKKMTYANGELYLVTSSGLSSFDGQLFKNYTTANGLIDDAITDIATDNTGKLWIASLNGVTNYDGTSFVHDSTKRAYNIAVDAMNRVYIFKFNSLFNIPGAPPACEIFEGGVWTVPTMSPFSYVQSFPDLKKTKSGDLISYSKTGDYYIKITYPFNVTRVNPKDEGSNILNIKEIEIDANNKSWIAASSLYAGADSTFNPFTIKPNSAQFENVDVNSGIIVAGKDQGIFIANSSIEPVPVTETIEVNNIRTRVDAMGLLFNNVKTLSPSFEFPKGNNSHGIFAGNFVVAAKKQSNPFYNVHPILPFRREMSPGPINNTNGASINFMAKVSLQEINTHKTQFNQSAYQMPDGIKNWPAVADTSIGVALDLAPFVDVNNDGCYSPSLGDYPKILGDEAIYWINHPDNNALPFEYHYMLYGYNSSNDPDINQSLFLKYTIVNRDPSPYDSVKVGFYLDTDLGNPRDDYVGCDSLENIMYTYNGDLFDENVGGFNGYGSNRPALGAKYLSDSMDTYTYYNSGGGVTGEPNNEQEWLNILNGNWKNGSPSYYGGNGWNSQGTTSIPSKYMFTGDPFLSTGWTERTPGGSAPANAPGDRRQFASIPYFSLAPGQRRSIDLVVAYGQKSGASTAMGENISELISVLNHAKTVYDTMNYSGFTYGTTTPCAIATGLSQEDASQTFSLFPNPSNGLVQIKSTEKITGIRVVDINGRLVYQIQEINKFETQIQLPKNLVDGIYFIEARMGEKVKTMKLVLQG